MINHFLKQVKKEVNKELKKMFIFNSSLIIAENASGYLFLWKLLESYPPVVAFTLSFLHTYISPIVDLVVPPIVDQIRNKPNSLYIAEIARRARVNITQVIGALRGINMLCGLLQYYTKIYK